MVKTAQLPADPMSSIDRGSKVPLYHQLYEILRGQIITGAWQPGDLVPPESQLVEAYDISRTTVRQVLDMLVNEDLVVRQRGRGTFVTQPTLNQGLSRIISFTEDMRQRGLMPGTRVLQAEIVPAELEVAERLAVTLGAEMAHLKRLRLANDEPLSVEDSYLIHRFCPGVLDLDYARSPLRETLERRYSLRLSRAQQTIRAVGATKELGRLLGVRPNAPLLYIERISYTAQDVPVELLHVFHRGDRYALYNELLG
jgi:GntR family transcriptional regulator